MDLTTLKEMEPWEWPENACDLLLAIALDRHADESDRLLATQLAGDYSVVNDQIVEALLSLLHDSEESEELRGKAAISLGPVLEQCDTDGFDDPDDMLINEFTFHKTCESLRKLFSDTDVPKVVRRRILEAAVRAPQDWHREAVQVAHSSDDPEWNLTAVFAMRWIDGFDDEIIDALESEDEDLRYEAVCAAGSWELDAAWPYVADLVESSDTDKDMLLAAIEAAANIRPEEAGATLAHLLESDDEEIVEAVHDAVGLADMMSDPDFECDDDSDDEDEFDDDDDLEGDSEGDSEGDDDAGEEQDDSPER
ncbi:MAG: HEAT repeat domain-containing protein [Planctomycetota bacterium]